MRNLRLKFRMDHCGQRGGSLGKKKAWKRGCHAIKMWYLSLWILLLNMLASLLDWALFGAWFHNNIFNYNKSFGKINSVDEAAAQLSFVHPIKQKGIGSIPMGKRCRAPSQLPPPLRPKKERKKKKEQLIPNIIKELFNIKA